MHRSPGHFKSAGFPWKLILDTIPLRADLFGRGVITDLRDVDCTLCGVWSERVDLQFVTCRVASDVWYKIFMRLRWLFVFPLDLVFLYHGILGLFGGDEVRRGLLLI